MQMTTERWPEGVPRDYDELFRKYGGVVANEIRRLNVVAGNFQDHYQTVCEKILSAQVLPRFVARVQKCSDDDLPEQMTALEVCSLFGLNFPAWRSKMWSYHKVFLVDLGGKVPVEGKTHGTILNANGKDVSWVSWMPTPLSGGYGSPKAVYKTSEVLEIPALCYFRNLKFDTTAWPRRTVQPHHFQAYLLQAVRNHFSNACRTIMRRHKDRPGDCFSQFKGADGEYNSNWEDGLADPFANAGGIETTVELHEELDRVITEAERGEITALLASDYTIEEAVKMSSLDSGKKAVILRMCAV